VSTIHLEKIAKNFQMMTGLEDTITGWTGVHAFD
jgi:hypothetical protein